MKLTVLLRSQEPSINGCDACNIIHEWQDFQRQAHEVAQLPPNKDEAFVCFVFGQRRFCCSLSTSCCIKNTICWNCSSYALSSGDMGFPRKKTYELTLRSYAHSRNLAWGLKRRATHVSGKLWVQTTDEKEKWFVFRSRSSLTVARSERRRVRGAVLRSNPGRGVGLAGEPRGRKSSGKAGISPRIGCCTVFWMRSALAGGAMGRAAGGLAQAPECR